MRRYSVYAGPLSQVPYLASVIFTRRRYMKTIRREIDTVNGC